MIYTNTDKSKLPSIGTLVTLFENHMRTLEVRHLMPYDYAKEGNDLFLLNRTASGLYNLKPNITLNPCLFYGVNSIDEKITPKWNNLDRSEYLIQNVLREEFEITMESHPLYSLLKRGIETPKGLFRIINPYGLAMAYGFPTPMIPLTSSLDTAVFYATHRKMESGRWEPMPDYDESGNQMFGTLFFLYLSQPFPYMAGLSTIGLQAFKRPGNQKLFALQLPNGSDLGNHPLVSGFHFKHNPKEAARYTYLQDLLMPQELIAAKANDILTQKIVSEAAFERNCRNNPTENFVTNRSRLETCGVSITDSVAHKFTVQELTDYYKHAVEEWNDMLSHIVALHPGFDKILDGLKNFDFQSYIDTHRRL